MKQNINTTVVMELRVISKQFQYTDQEQAVIHTKKVSFRTQIQFKYMQLLPSCYIFLNSKITRGKKTTNKQQPEKKTPSGGKRNPYWKTKGHELVQNNWPSILGQILSISESIT